MTIKARIIRLFFKLEMLRLTKNIISSSGIDCNEHYKPPKSFYRKFKIDEIEINNFKCLIIKSKKNNNNLKHSLYIHGGGFIMQITKYHWKYIEWLIKKSNNIFWIPIYPCSTKNYSSHEDTLKLLIEVYKKINSLTISKNINIIGDSAGGNLSLVLAQQLASKNIDKPNNIVMFSPCVTMYLDHKDIKNNEKVLPKLLLETASKWYFGDNKIDNPKFSPLYGQLNNIGKINIFIGTNECFLSGVLELENKLKKQGINYRLYITNKMFHVFNIFKIKEAKFVNKKIIEIIKN